MLLYQPAIQTHRYNFWKSAWVPYKFYPSTLVFKSNREADMYKHDFISGLKRAGVKLKEGHFSFHITEIKLINNGTI